MAVDISDELVGNAKFQFAIFKRSLAEHGSRELSRKHDRKHFQSDGRHIPAIVSAHFVAPQTILLWNGEEIEYALKNRYMRKGLIEKYRSCIEQGLPDYNILLRRVSW